MQVSARAIGASALSGMGRRVARLVDEGLVCRDRAVPTPVVSWWRSPRPASAASLRRRPSTPAGISKLFVAQLNEELAVLEHGSHTPGRAHRL
jgi:hypothetical protein